MLLGLINQVSIKKEEPAQEDVLHMPPIILSNNSAKCKKNYNANGNQG